MLRTLRDKIGADPDLPERAHDLDIYRRVLDGTLYDVLKYSFHQERSGDGKYLPIAERRPSTRYNMCRIVVDDTASLLFSEGRFPTVMCEDVDDRKMWARLVKETGLNTLMAEAITTGSVGSVAIQLRIIKGRVFFAVLRTLYLTPEWDAEAPDTLSSVTEKYKVRGDVLAKSGYSIADDEMAATFWFERVWDQTSETWYLPRRVGTDPNGKPWPRVVDTGRTVRHGHGFVPMVWIKNLAGGTDPDGDCTFRAAIEMQIELEYQLSQAGRGLKYSSDPTLLIKEPAAADDEIVKSAGNALIVSEKGDAKLLEIGGTAAAAVVDYVQTLRELGMEQIHGNRSKADRVTAAQSGRAMELMHQNLIWLGDRLRVSYGEQGILQLLQLVLTASRASVLRLRDGTKIAFKSSDDMSLDWPPWFHLTQQDMLDQANTVTILTNNNILTRESGTRIVAPNFEIVDAPGEARKTDAQLADEHARAMAMKASVTATDPLSP